MDFMINYPVGTPLLTTSVSKEVDLDIRLMILCKAVNHREVNIELSGLGIGSEEDPDRSAHSISMLMIKIDLDEASSVG